MGIAGMSTNAKPDPDRLQPVFLRDQCATQELLKTKLGLRHSERQASYPCGNFSDTSFFKLRNKEDR